MQYSNPTRFLLSKVSILFPDSISAYILDKRLITALGVFILFVSLYWKPSTGVIAPYVGYRSRWEPPLLVQIRYVFSASSMISEGNSGKWKDFMFQVSRYDGDVLILSRKYLDDLHNKPTQELSAIDGLIQNFGGRYSGICLLKQNDVGIRALQLKLTPNLSKLCADMKDEFEYCLSIDLPPCEGILQLGIPITTTLWTGKLIMTTADWTSVAIQPFFLRAVERMTHRIFVGLPLCRDPKWLDAAFGHADNMTMMQIAMRSVPKVLQPLLNLCLPWSWKYKACILAGRDILIPEVRRRRKLQKDKFDQKENDDLLQAMIDMTNPEDEDGKPKVLAKLMLTMTAVAGHSTAAAGSFALFDLVSRDEYIDSLRDEALKVLKDNEMAFTKQALVNLRKLDSFLRELVLPNLTLYPKYFILANDGDFHRSQRFNPLALLGFFRVVKAPGGITLQDGTHVPYGTRLCIPPHSIGNDSDIVEDADSFDGFRYYKLRCQNPGENNKHQYATTDKAHLHFGYGRWACPGRFMASDILKIIITTLLLRYEIKYSEGAKRPENGFFHEFPLVNIQTPLLLKRRDDIPVF